MSPSDDEDWIEINLGPYLNTDARGRIRRAFDIANFIGTSHIAKVDVVNMGEHGRWTRLVFTDKMQRPTRTVPQPTCQNAEWVNEYHGVHLTDTSAFVSVLKDKRLRRMSYSGVYCLLTVNPRNFDELKREIFHKAVVHPKNTSNVMFELKASGYHSPTQSDGTWGDNAIASEGRIAHYKSGKESRWLVPEDLIFLKAVWLNDDSILNIATLDFGATL